MNNPQRPELAVLDEIDALVDAQMAQESSGYDHNINQDMCPHCPEAWHGLKITQRMQQMRDAFSLIQHASEHVQERLAQFLKNYSYSDDQSEVICPGSGYTGEWKLGRHSGGAAATWPY